MEYGSSVLPDWLHLSRYVDPEDCRLILCLEGVAGPREIGKRIYFEVSSLSNDHVTATNCDHVTSKADDRDLNFTGRHDRENIRNSSTYGVFDFLLDDDFTSDIFAVTVENGLHQAERFAGDQAFICKDDEDSIEAVVTIDVDFHRASAFDRVALFKRFCEFLGLPIDLVQMLPSEDAIQFSQSDWLVAGPGDSPRVASDEDELVFQFRLGCGRVNDDGMEVLATLERTAGDGGLRDAIGGRVVGWFVTKPAKRPRLRNLVRHARAIPTGTPIPRRTAPTPKPFPTKVIDSGSTIGSGPQVNSPSSALRPLSSKKSRGRQRQKSKYNASLRMSSLLLATQSVAMVTPSRQVDVESSILHEDPFTGKLYGIDSNKKSEVILEPSITVPFTQRSISMYTTTLPKHIEGNLGTSARYTTEISNKEISDKFDSEIDAKESNTTQVESEIKLSTSNPDDSINLALSQNKTKHMDTVTTISLIETTVNGILKPLIPSIDSLEHKDSVSFRVSNALDLGLSAIHFEGAESSKFLNSSNPIQSVDVGSQAVEPVTSTTATSTSTTSRGISNVAAETSTPGEIPFEMLYQSTLRLNGTLQLNQKTVPTQKRKKEMTAFRFNTDTVNVRRRSTINPAKHKDISVFWPKSIPKSTTTPVSPRVRFFVTTKKAKGGAGGGSGRKAKKTQAPRSNGKIRQNLAPEVRRGLGKIDALVGTVLRFRIPNETFYDEDGFTDKLELLLLDGVPAEKSGSRSGGLGRSLATVPPTSWVQLNSTSQVLYGLPSANDIGFHQFWLAAIDKEKRLTHTRFDIRVQRRPQFASTLNHEFRAVLDLNFGLVEKNVDTRIGIVRNISAAFRDRNTDNVVVTDIRNGSVQFYWANSSLLGLDCPVRVLRALRDHVITPDRRPSTEFIRAMHPTRVASVELEPRGACVDLLDWQDMNYGKVPGIGQIVDGSDEEEVRRKPKETEDANFLLYILIPMVVLAATLLLLLIFCIACHGYRKRKKQRETKGIPVIFTDELNAATRSTGHMSRPVLADEVITPFQSPPTYNQSLPGSRYSTMKSQSKRYDDDDDSTSSRFSSDLEPPISPHSIGRSFPAWPPTRGPPPPYIEPYRLRYA